MLNCSQEQLVNYTMDATADRVTVTAPGEMHGNAMYPNT